MNFIYKILINFLILFNITNAYKINHLSYKSNKLRTSLPLMNTCPDYLEKFTNSFNIEKSEEIVKGTTSFLTKVDGIGGYILHTNDIIINTILNNDLIDMQTKKTIILKLIEFSQMGDATGHSILQVYYDLVNCLL
jgi:hypothetical protein